MVASKDHPPTATSLSEETPAQLASRLAEALFTSFSQPDRLTDEQFSYRKRLLHLLAQQGPIDLSHDELTDSLDLVHGIGVHGEVLRLSRMIIDIRRHFQSLLLTQPDIFQSAPIETLVHHVQESPPLLETLALDARSVGYLLGLEPAKIDALCQLLKVLYTVSGSSSRILPLELLGCMSLENIQYVLERGAEDANFLKGLIEYLLSSSKSRADVMRLDLERFGPVIDYVASLRNRSYMNLTPETVAFLAQRSVEFVRELLDILSKLPPSSYEEHLAILPKDPKFVHLTDDKILEAFRTVNSERPFKGQNLYEKLERLSEDSRSDLPPAPSPPPDAQMVKIH